MTINDKRMTVVFDRLSSEDVATYVNDFEGAGFQYDEIRIEVSGR